jgi:hypothetical protein
MRSTSLTLSSSLHVKGLTQRCYIWNDKAYKLALTLLSFQGGAKPTNHNHTNHLGYMGQLHNYNKLQMGWGVTAIGYASSVGQELSSLLGALY